MADNSDLDGLEADALRAMLIDVRAELVAAIPPAIIWEEEFDMYITVAIGSRLGYGRLGGCWSWWSSQGPSTAAV